MPNQITGTTKPASPVAPFCAIFQPRFEREDQTFVPTKELREVEIDRALRLLRQGTAGLL
jgi:hypothetical protein